VRAVRSQAPQDRRARSDAPYQPDKMRIAVEMAVEMALRIGPNVPDPMFFASNCREIIVPQS
jgi:hypothetical protein